MESDYITVIVVIDDDGAFAQGIEVDYVADGTSVDDALVKFRHGLAASLVERAEGGITTWPDPLSDAGYLFFDSDSIDLQRQAVLTRIPTRDIRRLANQIVFDPNGRS